MKYRRILSAFLLTTITMLGLSGASQAQEVTKPLNKADAIAKARQEGKLMMVQIGRPDCSDCRGVSNHLTKVSPPMKQTLMAGYVYWYVNIDRSSEHLSYVQGMGQYALPVLCAVDPNDANGYMYRGNGNMTPNTILMNMRNQMAKLPIHILNHPEKPVTNALFQVAGVARKSSLEGGTGTNAIESVQWRLNSDPWQAASSSSEWSEWTADVVLQPGTNYFYCYVKAGPANSWTNRTTFVYQGPAANLPPAITAQPQPASGLAGELVSFTVDATGTPPLFYRWQKQGIDLADSTRVTGSQSEELSINDLLNADEGDYRVVITNAYGSVTSSVANLKLVIDSQSPQITVNSHQNEQSITGSSVTLTGTISDPAPSGGIGSVTAAGQPANLSGLQWTITINNLQIGPNPFEIVAIDNAGHATTLPFNLVRLPKDETAPVLQITSHHSGQTVASRITLAGTAQDEGNGVAWVKVNGVNAAGGTATEGNPANWSAALTRLRTGTNLITVTTADLLGNNRTIQTIIILDSTSPVIAVKTPARNSQIGQEYVALSGTAGDNIVAVYYQLNSSDWLLADGTGVWSDGAYALPGANVLRAYSVDTAGRTSTVAVVNFTYNRLMGFKGAYGGIFQPAAASPVTVSNAGFFSLQLSDKGSFSGKLLMGLSSLPFSGNFDQAEMTAQVEVKRRSPLPPLTLSLRINRELENPASGVMDTNIISGSVAEGSAWTSELRAVRAVGKAKVAGDYTMLIEGCGYWGNCFGVNTNQPNGDSPASVKVTTGGIVQMSGTLADGTRTRQSASVSEGGYWPVYVSLYGGKGLLIGWMANIWTTNVVNDPRSGMLNWVQPADLAGSHYTEGFSQPRVTRLTSYKKTLAGKNPVKWTHADVVMTGGNIPFEQPLTNHVVLTNGVFTIEPGTIPGLSLKVIPSSGLFYGLFTNPVSGKSTKISGALADTEDVMAEGSSGGWWLGPNKESGNIRIYPTE